MQISRFQKRFSITIHSNSNSLYFEIESILFIIFIVSILLNSLSYPSISYPLLLFIHYYHIHTIYCSGTEYFLSRDILFTAPGQSSFCSGTDYLLLWDRVFSAPGQTVWLGSTHRREFTKERAFDMGVDERRHRL